jgi:hypothetical protein
MARVATITSRRRGGPINIGNVTEADSQSFVQGAPVYLTAGTVVAAAHAAIHAATYKLAGLASRAATNVASGNVEVPIQVIRAGDELRVACTASGTDKSAADFARGTYYGCYIASGILYVDYDNTSNAVFKFVKPCAKANDGTSYEAIVEAASAFLEFP